jgi:hypothetical protein
MKPIDTTSAYGINFYLKNRSLILEKIKDRIAKLLRLAMSENQHEAELAAAKAVELMQRYALSHDDLEIKELFTKTIELDYARIPIWIRELYSNMARVNGCYMVWINGWRHRYKKSGKRAKIVLTGRESDVLNVEYLLCVFIREVESHANRYAVSLGRVQKKRAKLRDYRLGLGKGLVERMAEAMQKWEDKPLDSNLPNPPVPMKNRYDEAKEHYRSEHKVRCVRTHINKGSDYFIGMADAAKVELRRPLEGDSTQQHLLQK